MNKGRKGNKHNTNISSLKLHNKGITLVALVVTIIVLLILAGVTITILMGDNGIITKAQDAADATNAAVEGELEGMNNLGDKMNSILGGTGTGGDDTVEMPSNWDSSKVVAVKSDDGKTVPVPIGFTKSTVEGEGSVDTGFVIKQGNDGSATSGINEFVWVPVEDPSEMFGTDSNGNSLGKLYDFGTSSSPKNPPEARNWTETGGEMSWESATSFREPDIITKYDGSDASSSSYFTAAIGNITGAEFKAQLQQEFEDMRDSVETYGGFYIGRYETGNLSQETAVVQKNNTDIGNKKWYEMYQKCKTVVEESETIKGTTSMIWGCQWDATMKWFLESEDPEVVEYVTDSTDKGNYAGTQGNTNQPIATGSNNNYSVNKIYDMAGNVDEWTLEAYNTDYRVLRGGSYDVSSLPASIRSSLVNPARSLSSYGCRLTLYVK